MKLAIPRLEIQKILIVGQFGKVVRHFFERPAGRFGDVDVDKGGTEEANQRQRPKEALPGNGIGDGQQSGSHHGRRDAVRKERDADGLGPDAGAKHFGHDDPRPGADAETEKGQVRGQAEHRQELARGRVARNGEADKKQGTGAAWKLTRGSNRE